MAKTVKTTVEHTYRYVLYHDDLLTFDWASVPEDAEIVMVVPGGGDWSHKTLDTTYEPLVVTWTITECNETYEP